MQRVNGAGRVFLRHNSTDATLKGTFRKGPLVSQLGSVIIPSAAEIQADMRARAEKPGYKVDLSYLEGASDNFLSAKLARRLSSPQTAPAKPKPSFSGKLPSLPPTSAPRPALSPEELNSVTAKRREVRILRGAEQAEIRLRTFRPVSENSSILAKEFEKADSFLSPEKSVDILASAARRRAERDTRSRGRSGGGGPRPRGQEASEGESEAPAPGKARSSRSRKPLQAAAPMRKQAIGPRKPAGDETALAAFEDIDESIFTRTDFQPEFEGPPTASSTLVDAFGPAFDAFGTPFGTTVVTESGKSFSVPTSRIDSFHRGDYSSYMTVPTKDFATPPDLLGAVKTAGRTLSHQQHYSLPARDRTMKFVTKAAQPAAKRAPKPS